MANFPWAWPRVVVPISRSATALRAVMSEGLFGKPFVMNTRVDWDLARSLYRNDNPDYNLGAGFVKPIINLTVEYTGLPYVTSDVGDRDTFLNEAIHDHWATGIQELFTALLRDSKAIIRFRQPRIDNPLFTEEDRMHGRIEVVQPELVDITFDPTDPDLIERAAFTHYVWIDERTDAEVLQGTTPRGSEHEVLEVITADAYRFFDKTDDRELESWRTANTWGFVPAWPAYNEYDSTLGGGQSDIESVLPFIKAFHDVLSQALKSHQYHSVPKAKFKLNDVDTFLVNNYPGVIDPDTGRPKAGASINWSGKEIFFFDVEEDAEFIEARSVLGDSKTLLDFLIDCIAIASETPKWALLKVETANPNDASVKTFEKKIQRKRIMFNTPIIMLCKMALASRGQAPVTMRVTWPTVNIETLVSKGQAIQQIVMALDVATSHEWIADQTVIQILSTMFPEISDPETEKALAKSNVIPEVPAPAPASPTQAAPPPSNGKTSPGAAKRALATTSASRS
jgi:hypothetical protein